MAYRLGIIGGGNMGSAIVRGSLAAGVFRPDEIIVVEVDAARRKSLAELGCAISDKTGAAANSPHLLLAVKPQIFPDVARSLPSLSPETIVVSIMAGLNSENIRRILDGRGRIVRAMPNTPCQIGEGMTAIALGVGAQPGDERIALDIFNAIGRTVMVDESLMYAVTAVSGSGPAYIFLLAEAMEQAAISLGLDAPTAGVLVEQTVIGAGKLLRESDQSAADLRAAVTSPGGTTAAALDVLKRDGFTPIVVNALTAARDRGVQLDRGQKGSA